MLSRSADTAVVVVGPSTEGTNRFRGGYFEYPRKADAEEVAAAAGIARSTFAEHLAAAHGVRGGR